MKYQLETPMVERTILPGGYARLGFEDAGFAGACAPGQFLTLRTSRDDAPLLRRPFGVHDVLGARVRFLVRVVGPGTRQLAACQLGDTLDVLGPLGTGFILPDTPSTVLLVAGGIGIAPLLFLARRLIEQKGHDVRLFFGGATKSDLPTREDFASLNVPVTATTLDGSFGQKGLVTEPMTQVLEEGFSLPAHLMACGPPAMLTEVARIAGQTETPCQVSLENVMACGVGSCLGCVTEVVDCGQTTAGAPCYERVCAEGPVFDARAIRWKEVR